MVNLNVERINTHSPYLVQYNPAKNYYYFCTDYDIRYIVRFDQEDIIICSTSYQFSIINQDDRKSPRDKKLRLTIMAIIAEFFECNNVTILYICDTSDGKQQMRSRLFAAWYNSYKEKYKFLFYSAPIQDEDITNYATILLRMDNPKATEILAEFTETVQMLNAKPSEE